MTALAGMRRVHKDVDFARAALKPCLPRWQIVFRQIPVGNLDRQFVDVRIVEIDDMIRFAGEHFDHVALPLQRSRDASGNQVIAEPTEPCDACPPVHDASTPRQIPASSATNANRCSPSNLLSSAFCLRRSAIIALPTAVLAAIASYCDRLARMSLVIW